MHKRIKRKKRRKYIYFSVVIVVIVMGVLFFQRDSHVFARTNNIENVKIVDDGKISYLYDIKAKNIQNVLDEYNNNLSEEDRIFPNRDKKVFSGDIITIDREKKLTVKVDGEEQVFETFGDKIAYVLDVNNVELDENDIIVPNGDTMISDDIEAEITRVEFKEELVTKKIPFETVLKKDDKVNFLKKYTDQEGKNGSKELVYKVAYHNGQEVDRKMEEERIIKEAVDEVVVQGTKVKLGKKHGGACSWYAHTGTLSAANPWLPKGSYVKVTNKANGKSVIVQINDRGPFVAGRIVDLDKVAFQQIASLGAGVIDVKMEEVVN
ncbi:MAG: G5 domain-containing protein [Patescibacteria group bacterium]|nr:G5 domain-containing protein [Patescibacteria group bacterium]